MHYDKILAFTQFEVQFSQFLPDVQGQASQVHFLTHPLVVVVVDLKRLQQMLF